MKLFIQYRPKMQIKRKLKKNFEFIDLSTSGNIPKNLINNTFSGFNTITITHEDKSIKLMKIIQYLYENGGIYVQKLKCSPEIFIKNNEMVIYDIHYFSSIKHSPTLKKILDELGTTPDTKKILDVFNKHTKDKHLFKFNHSFSLLIG